jgi:hypothetical protein
VLGFLLLTTVHHAAGHQHLIHDALAQPKFEGYKVWTAESLDGMNLGLPSTCTTALTETIRCDGHTETFISHRLFGSPSDQSVTDSICDTSCGQSLKAWFDGVSLACDGYTISNALPTLRGGWIWAGYNSTCLKDAITGEYCNGKNPLNVYAPSASLVTPQM